MIPTLCVSHVSVLQILIAYFRNSPVENCMDIHVPLRTVIKFTPARGGGWSESVHELLSPFDDDHDHDDERAIMQKDAGSDDSDTSSQITEAMTDEYGLVLSPSSSSSSSANNVFFD